MTGFKNTTQVSMVLKPVFHRQGGCASVRLIAFDLTGMPKQGQKSSAPVVKTAAMVCDIGFSAHLACHTC